MLGATIKNTVAQDLCTTGIMYCFVLLKHSHFLLSMCHDDEIYTVKCPHVFDNPLLLLFKLITENKIRAII
jgi:hypothetical protein